jgi:hypothetical protein
MQRRDGHLLLAPTDISNHLACRHLTQLDRARAEGRLDFEPRKDPRIDALRHAVHDERAEPADPLARAVKLAGAADVDETRAGRRWAERAAALSPS